MRAITINEMLRTRDGRVVRQRALQTQYGLPLLSFTMNMAGEYKYTPLSEYAFRAGCGAIERLLGAPVYREEVIAATGCEAYYIYDKPAEAVKAACLTIEEGSAVGRLYDLDVLTVAGEKLSRTAPRKCLVCGGEVALCARSRAHGLDAIVTKTSAILADFCAEHASDLAVSALVSEAEFTPKPGLVDRNNCGSHHDMDLALLRKSAAVLRPHFARFVALGMAHADARTLQREGLAAEQTMFAATGGVNTHKGALYALALLLAALGRKMSGGEGTLFSLAASIAAELTPPEDTHGSAVRERYGAKGARHEALAAFPTVQRTGAILDRDGPLAALLYAMAHLEDTTLLYRGGIEGLALVRQRAGAILAAPAAQHEALALALDEELIQRHLSCGGSADILALCLFMKEVGPLLPTEG